LSASGGAAGAGGGPGGGEPFGVLFVCTGNICRSPLAEGVFLRLARERGVASRFRVDSAGTTAYHAGERPDPRSLEVADRHGVELPGRARRIDPSADWDRFGLIVVMDHDHVHAVTEEGAPAERVRLLRSYDRSVGKTHQELLSSGEGAVPDPYWGGEDGFERVHAMVRAGCEGLLDELLAGLAERA
jgi:protein-tyrosine phosphatase